MRLGFPGRSSGITMGESDEEVFIDFRSPYFAGLIAGVGLVLRQFPTLAAVLALLCKPPI